MRQALGLWLGGLIDVGDVTVQTSDDAGSLLDPSTGMLEIAITYTLLDTRTTQQTRVVLP